MHPMHPMHPDKIIFLIFYEFHWRRMTLRPRWRREFKGKPANEANIILKMYYKWDAQHQHPRKHILLMARSPHQRNHQTHVK